MDTDSPMSGQAGKCPLFFDSGRAEFANPADFWELLSQMSVKFELSAARLLQVFYAVTVGKSFIMKHDSRNEQGSTCEARVRVSGGI